MRQPLLGPPGNPLPNASTEPNIELKGNREDSFQTIKKIKAGEELTVDYQKDLKDTDCKYNYKY